ncbi:MAG: ankyrin repeat domain-containing protein [Bryobacterales bacterium]|nr:ankyrin repeat domain-containing protein [Bryobacterales bacterium]
MSAPIDYDKQVKPILATKCFSCHGEKQAQSGLRLDLRQNALRGGDYGAVIIPGKSAASRLIDRVSGPKAGMQMPPTGPLEEQEIAILKAWIDEGADMPGRANEAPRPVKKTDAKTQSFLDVIHQRDLAAVRKALRADKSLAQARDAWGSTALLHAAYDGSLEIVNELLAAGADVRAMNERKATALHWATADAAKVQRLLRAGADVDAKTVEGRTALAMAAMRPDGAAVVKLLLEAKADPNSRSTTGATPLFAAAGASLENVKLLLAAGADAKITSATGGTVLMAAAKYPEIASLLVKHGAAPAAKTKRGETALAMAANNGNFETAKLLVSQGADVNATDYRGYTPLMHAAYRDGVDPQLVKYLLAHGARAEATGEGETALTLAKKRGSVEVVRMLDAKAAAGPVKASGADGGKPAGREQLTRAIQNGLVLLEKTSPKFVRTGGCTSCHNQMLPLAAQAMARARGVKTGETIAYLDPATNEFTPERYLEYNGFGPNSLGYELFSYVAMRRPLDARIASQIQYLKAMQQPAGHWATPGNRPPLTFDDFTTTAFAIQALRTYASPVQQSEHQARIARARSWLLEAKPVLTQERSYQLLGLAWAKAERGAMEKAAAGLKQMQRADGGWSQLVNLPSDAYATGMALWALAEGGLSTKDAAFQAGLAYLLRTQAADGTWHVRTRALPVQPYFESGYPYGHDQWISAAGAAYAVMALTSALENERAAK